MKFHRIILLFSIYKPAKQTAQKCAKTSSINVPEYFIDDNDWQIMLLIIFRLYIFKPQVQTTRSKWKKIERHILFDFSFRIRSIYFNLGWCIEYWLVLWICTRSSWAKMVSSQMYCRWPEEDNYWFEPLAQKSKSKFVLKFLPFLHDITIFF